MDRPDTGQLIDEELLRIPGGSCGPFQRMLRLEYKRTRLRHLTADPSAGHDVALSEAVARVRTYFPNATFVYDETFFDVWSAVAPDTGRRLPGNVEVGGPQAPRALLPTGNSMGLN